MKDEMSKVLLVEDNLIDQKAFIRFCEKEKAQFRYVITCSVAEALLRLKKETFDLILVDFKLSDGTAIDILSYIKNIPIVVITGAGNEEIAVRALRAGAWDYLIKDLERNYLKMLPEVVRRTILNGKNRKMTGLLTHAVMSVSDSIYITDLSDAIIFVNKAFCTAYGYSQEQIIGQQSNVLWKTVSENDHITNMLLNTTDVEWSGEVLHLRKTGEEYPILLSRSVIRDDGDNKMAITGIARDFTEQRALEREKELLIATFQQSLSKLKSLDAPLQFCVSCTRIRDNQGIWIETEDFIRRNSRSAISRGYCEDCKEKLLHEHVEDS